jgi:hypothetical protein
LEEYVDANFEVLSRPNHFLGGWLNSDLYYLDVSVAISGREHALQFASDNNQEAIWDPVTKQSIAVGMPVGRQREEQVAVGAIA